VSVVTSDSALVPLVSSHLPQHGFSEAGYAGETTDQKGGECPLIKRIDTRTQGWFKQGIVLALVSLLFSCATTEDVRILDDELVQLNSQVNKLQRETESLKKDFSSSQQELQASRNESKKDASSLQRENNALKADLLLRLENLQSEVKILSSGVEEYKEFLKRPSKDVDRVKEEIALRTKILEERLKSYEEKNKVLEERNKGFEDRTKSLEGKNKALEDRLKGIDGKVDQMVTRQAETEKTTPAKEKESFAETTKISPSANLSTGAGNLYKEAYETYQKGDLEGARRKFESFLKQYPHTELSDNAQFWIGETYYQKKDFEKAILEYEKAITKYPEGDKISAALFKQALAFSELGDKSSARNLLRRVIERYPQSEQADMAKKRLETLK
jgi:tol-pal system protein YbgF